MLGAWVSNVVVDEVDAIEAIRKDMHIIINFLVCWQLLTKWCKVLL